MPESKPEDIEIRPVAAASQEFPVYRAPLTSLDGHLHSLLRRASDALEKGLEARAAEFLVYARRSLLVLRDRDYPGHPDLDNRQYLLGLCYYALTFTTKPTHAMMPMVVTAVTRALSPGPLEATVVLTIRDALIQEGWDIQPV